MRVSSWPAKIGLLIVGNIVISLLTNIVLFPFELNDSTLTHISSVISGTYIYFLTRIFRAEGETPSPRPWWQVTGRPTAAFWLALYLGLLSGVALVFELVEFFSGGKLFGDFLGDSVNILGMLVNVALGGLYYLTWWKLRKSNPRVLGGA